MRKPGKYALLFPTDDSRCVSRTKQSFAKDADINNILAKFLKTGVLGSGLVSERIGAFADVSSGDSYRNVLDKVAAAEASFMTLDSDVRFRFDNKVANVLDFLADPDNHDEAVELGLIEAPAPPEAPLGPDVVHETLPKTPVDPDAPVEPLETPEEST